jgi:hypothetical protein
MKLIPFPQKQNLNEIYSSGMQYAMVSRVGELCTPFIHCRDYINEAIWATLHQKPASIYGFTYNPKTMPPIDLENIRLLLVNSQDKSLIEKANNVIEFINQFEKHLHLDLSVAEVVTDGIPNKYNGGLLIVGSGRWQEAPPLLSMYTLLLRVGFTHKIGDSWENTINNILNGSVAPYQKNDKNYLVSAKKAIDDIMKIGYRPFFYVEPKKNYPENIDIGTLHNSSGIVGFSSGQTKGIVKYWSRPSLKLRLEGKTKEEAEAIVKAKKEEKEAKKKLAEVE